MGSIQRIKIIVICLFASFVISGLLNPMGLIAEPIAEWFGTSITAAQARFVYFTTGVFCGYVLSFYLYDYLKLKSVVVVGYLLVASAIACLVLVNNSVVFTASLFVMGVAASIQVCGASTLVSWLWEGKARQTMLLAQDAMFNAGGIIFTAVTTAFLSRGMHWGSTYVVVAAVAVLIALIALSTRIDQKYEHGSENDGLTYWSVGILVVGLSVLLFMTAKISIFLWLPQYVAQEFAATIEQSGRLMQNIFVGALVGSLAGTFVVSKVRVEYFLLGMLVIGATGIWFMLAAGDLDTVLLIAYAVGASVGATFNAYMGFGLSFVASPTHKNVAYVLLAGGVGAAVAPVFSSKIVELQGTVGSALYACFTLQIVVLVSVLLLTTARQRVSTAI